MEKVKIEAICDVYLKKDAPDRKHKALGKTFAEVLRRELGQYDNTRSQKASGTKIQ